MISSFAVFSFDVFKKKYDITVTVKVPSVNFLNPCFYKLLHVPVCVCIFINNIKCFAVLNL